MNLPEITEELKESARELINRNYSPEEAEQKLKGRGDYILFKLNEVFRNADTERNGEITLDELYDFLTLKGAEKKKDPNYELSLEQKESVRRFFEELDPEGYGSIEM